LEFFRTGSEQSGQLTRYKRRTNDPLPTAAPKRPGANAPVRVGFHRLVDRRDHGAVIPTRTDNRIDNRTDNLSRHSDEMKRVRGRLHGDQPGDILGIDDI
jgi:hypothetical protein